MSGTGSTPAAAAPPVVAAVPPPVVDTSTVSPAPPAHRTAVAEGLSGQAVVRLLVRPAVGKAVRRGVALTRLDPFGYVLLYEHVAVLAEAQPSRRVERGEQVRIIHMDSADRPATPPQDNPEEG
jgi:hypothetical protein